tara:strand:+ start:314 stop:457 length:144 start_codon:yes stop_codon:yes gene_type:complete
MKKIIIPRRKGINIFRLKKNSVNKADKKRKIVILIIKLSLIILRLIN